MRRLKILGQGNHIGKRLMLLIILFSSLITLVTTAVQLVVDYRQQRRAMDAVLETAGVYVPIIADSVWALDKVQISLALLALVQMPNIELARVVTTDGKGEWSAGKGVQSHNIVSRAFSLTRQVRGETEKIATLEVIASLDAIYRNLLEQTISILLGNALKTFVVAIFMFVVFRRVVTSRIEQLANNIAALPPQMLPESYLLEHETISGLAPGGDEIDALEGAFEVMGRRLRRAIDALTEYQAHLEEMVELRTTEVVQQKERLAIALRDRTQANEELKLALQKLRDAQEELIEREKLAALGALVAGVAHELNTPIGNSLTSATTLLDVTDSFDRKVASGLKRSDLEAHVSMTRSAVELVVRNLQRAAELLHGFKQVAVDRASEQRRRFDLRDLVVETMTLLKPFLRKTPYTLDIQIPDVELDSYPGPLGQVLTNLVNNAVTHGFDGRSYGTITLQATVLDSERIELRISDDGQGIEVDDQAHIFDPFFTTKLGQGGSGLGLNIAQGIVTGVLGGKISVESRLGAGSIFTITLPRNAPA